MSVLRRFITLILVALVAGGCSKYVEIPRDQLDTVPDREDGYRVNLTDGSRLQVALDFPRRTKCVVR